MTSRPLEGLRVVDLSRTAAGQQAAGLLGDYGADVVLVEAPGGAALRQQDPAAASVYNRNKRSVTADLASAEGRHAVLGLASWADVLIADWTKAEEAQLGLTAQALKSANPHLIQCIVEGFGGEGAWSTLPAHEAFVHALLGTMAVQAGHREGPIFEGLPFATTGAAQLAVVGILATLYRRMDDGVGRRVETSLLDGAMAFHTMLWGESDAALAKGEKRLDMRGATKLRLITRSFICSDDAYVGVHTGAVGAFGRLMQVLGLDDKIPPSESGLDMGIELTPEQADYLEANIHTIFASQPAAHWVNRLMEADVCCVEHLPPTECFTQAQVIHNKMVVTVDDHELGKIQQVAPGIRFNGAAPMQPAPAPRVGEHNSAALESTPSAWTRDLPKNTAPDQRPLLDGVKVFDIGAYYAGPYSSRLLADFGANVIKVETIGGDQLRGLERPFFGAQAGKRSFAANLKAESVAPVIRKLVEWADAIHHNMRPGAAERLGVGVEQVRAINPDIIYLYAPGWGASGPHNVRQSFAPMLSGFVGVSYEVAGQFNEPMPSPGNEDPGNGLLGGVALLISLLHRRRTGKPLSCENPQLNASMGMVAHIVRGAEGAIGAGRLDVLQMGVDALESLYETSDGWLCLTARSDSEIAALERALGVAILKQAEFATAQARRENRDALTDVLRAAIAEHSTAQALQRLNAETTLAVVPVGDTGPHDILFDVEQRRMGRVAEVDHPKLGKVREFAQLTRVSDTTMPPHRTAPGLGEHTREILIECGFGERDIEAMRQRGDIRCA
ncbi:MAG: CoA transferase [Hyphomonadaceae bacterium]